jgi:polysaccharide export outer membrane protein
MLMGNKYLCLNQYTNLLHRPVKWVLFTLAGFITSCVTPKQLVYFQGDTSRPDSALVKPYITSIQAGDLLSVQVSSLNPEASSYFNPYTTISALERSGGNTQTTPLPAYTGYLVAPTGTITLPLAGAVRVAGMTNIQAADSIQSKLKIYLKEPTVSVRNLNFRITVLGEVARPSLFSITNEQITLPEALGLAGDLTIYGRRTNVMVVRQENGKRTYNRVDLTRRDVLQSPYFYLHPNDVVYVEPSNARIASTDRLFQIIPIVLSALSFVAIIATRW